MELKKLNNALEDFDKSIGLKRDFGEAYLNRRVVKCEFPLAGADCPDRNSLTEVS